MEERVRRMAEERMRRSSSLLTGDPGGGGETKVQKPTMLYRPRQHYRPKQGRGSLRFCSNGYGPLTRILIE